jgi:hypothetical protein
MKWQSMEKSVSFISLTWRDGQQLLNTLARRAVADARFRNWASAKSYPSQRPCPACEAKTFYQASWTTFFTGLYTRTCSACGYCDPKKVKMIKQL